MSSLDQFFTLTPERMLDLIERATGLRSTGRCLALNSMENRVYEIEIDSDKPHSIVCKFYRPGRWSRETILEEHAFLAELASDEVPAVVPIQLKNGSTIDVSDDGIFFTAFPKVRGRILQELDDNQLSQVGRLLARLHNIGNRKPASHRLTLSPQTYGWQALSMIETAMKKHAIIEPEIFARYEQTVTSVLKTIEPKFNRRETMRIHGDCHLGNVLWNGPSCFFVDFDDMVMGPPVQDVWLVVRGRGEEADRQRQVLLSGYEQMREFDYSTLELIEPLRALRMIHYAAWVAKRWEDPIFKNTFPDFATRKHWLEETADLLEQGQFF